MSDTSLLFSILARSNLSKTLNKDATATKALRGAFRVLGGGTVGDIAAVSKGLGVLSVVGAGAFAGLGVGIAGVGLGIAAIGIKAAAASEQVKSAFSGLAENAKATITQAAAPLVPVLTNVASQAQGLLKPLGASLGTAFKALAPALNSLVGSLASGLKPLIGALGPIAKAVSPLIKAIGAGLKPVLGALAGVLTMVAKTAGRFAPQLEQLFVGIGQIVTALGPLLSALIELGAPLLGPLIGLVAGLAGQISAALAPILSQLGPILAQVLTALMPLVGAIGLLLQAVLPILPPIAELILQLVTGLVPVLLPLIGLIAQLATTLIGILVPAWQFVVPILVTVIGWVGKVAEVILTVLLGAINWLVANVPKAWAGIQTAIGVAVGKIKSIIAWFGQLPGMIGRWVSGAKDAAVSRFSSMVSWVRGLPGRIKSAIGNLGSLLVNAGRSVVTGLWNGISSMGAWLRSTLIGWARNLIPGPIARALGISSPSKVLAKVVGRWIPPGIVKGAMDAAPAMNRALSNLVQPQRPAAPVMPFASSAPRPGSASPAEVIVRLEAGGAESELLRLFRKMVRIEGRGNVQVAFGRRPRGVPR